MPKLLRYIVTLLILLALMGHARSEPCTILRQDSAPCQIMQGQVAPYEGTLMTDDAANRLVSVVYQRDRLEIELEHQKALRLVDNKYNEELVFKLKKSLEGTDNLEFYESPWFWIAVIAAGVGGGVLGHSL